MLVFEDLQLGLLRTIKYILNPFQVLRVSLCHKLWLCDISVHITSLANCILFLLGVFLYELISSWVDKVDLDLGGSLVKIHPILSEDVVVEVFFLISRLNTFLGFRVLLSEKLDLIGFELNFSKNGDCFISSRVSPESTE